MTVLTDGGWVRTVTSRVKEDEVNSNQTMALLSPTPPLTTALKVCSVLKISRIAHQEAIEGLEKRCDVVVCISGTDWRMRDETCTSYSTGECTDFATKRMSAKMRDLLWICALVNDRLDKVVKDEAKCKQRK